jgi:hypothetical protein
MFIDIAGVLAVMVSIRAVEEVLKEMSGDANQSKPSLNADVSYMKDK